MPSSLSTMQLVRPMLLALCVFAVAACNDLPSDVGTELVPGTDTLYSISSISVPILPTATTVSAQTPLYNASYFLYGKTPDSDARMFVEFVQYPRLGAADSFEIVSSELLMYPQGYRYGDTSDLTLSIHAYELKQIWSAQATWDSIYDANGNSEYYSTTDPDVCNYEKVLASTDSVVYVPFDATATKRWLVLGSDSATRDQLFGLALQANAGSSIRQFRNLNNNIQIMKLRVIYKHADSTTNDTTWLESAVSYFVNTPPPADSTEVLVQGARIHRSQFSVQIDSLPKFAIILGGTFTISVNITSSNIGVYGMDEVLTLSYTKLDGSKIFYSARGNAAGQFNFPNVTAVLQSIRQDGGKGILTLEPEGENKYSRMNRLKLFDLNADDLHKPTLSIVYTVTTVLQ